MGASERNSFGDVAEEIARSFHVAYLKFNPRSRAEIQLHGEVRIWNDLSDKERAPLIAAVKKLLIDEVIEPGKRLSISEGE
jgi:hypothetical protein